MLRLPIIKPPIKKDAPEPIREMGYEKLDPADKDLSDRLSIGKQQIEWCCTWIAWLVTVVAVIILVGALVDGPTVWKLFWTILNKHFGTDGK